MLFWHPTILWVLLHLDLILGLILSNLHRVKVHGRRRKEMLKSTSVSPIYLSIVSFPIIYMLAMKTLFTFFYWTRRTWRWIAIYFNLYWICLLSTSPVSFCLSCHYETSIPFSPFIRHIVKYGHPWFMEGQSTIFFAKVLNTNSTTTRLWNQLAKYSRWRNLRPLKDITFTLDILTCQLSE